MFYILEAFLVYFFDSLHRFIDKLPILTEDAFKGILILFVLRLLYCIIPHFFIFFIAIIFIKKLNIMKIICLNVILTFTISFCLVLSLGSTLKEYFTNETTYYFLLSSFFSPIILNIFPFFRKNILNFSFK